MTIHSYEHFSSFDIKLKLLIESAFGRYIVGVYFLGAPLMLGLIKIGDLFNINLIRPIGESGIIILLLLPVALTIPVWIVLIFSQYIIRSLRKQKEYFSQTISYHENTDEIIFRLNGIRSTFMTIKTFLGFLGFFRVFKLGIEGEKIADISQSLHEEVSFFVDFIKNLRGDILYNVNQEKSSLEQAKSEASEYIHGTTELNQVSELQQARLDKQIEQFEELQRVLVKV